MFEPQCKYIKSTNFSKENMKQVIYIVDLYTVAKSFFILVQTSWIFKSE